MSRDLTIVIPTYRRYERLTVLLNRLIKVNDIITILISDDSDEQPPEYFLKLIRLFKNLRYIQNKSNLGFNANLIQAINATDSRYLMLVWDDELIHLDNLITLTRIVAKDDFGFIVPNYSINGNLYRGTSTTESISINLKKIRLYTSHAPGIVLNTGLAKAGINTFKKLLIEPSNVYPQVMLASYIYCMNNNCISIPIDICYNTTPLPSGLGNYSNLGARWNQWKIFYDFYENLHAIIKNVETEEQIRRHALLAMRFLLTGASSEDPKYQIALVKSIKKLFDENKNS